MILNNNLKFLKIDQILSIKLINKKIEVKDILI